MKVSSNYVRAVAATDPKLRSELAKALPFDASQVRRGQSIVKRRDTTLKGGITEFRIEVKDGTLIVRF